MSGMSMMPPAPGAPGTTQLDYAPSKVEITLSARDLPNMDTLSKSDPLAVLYYMNPQSHCFQEVGRTEMIKDNLNPVWVKAFVVDYFFEEVQTFKVAVYDVDQPSGPLSAQDFMGEARFDLGEVIGARGSTLAKNLVIPNARSRSKGNLVVHCEEVANNNGMARFTFAGRKLDKKDFFGKSDPFILLYRTSDSAAPVLVYKSEVVKKTLNPSWRTFEIPTNRLCSNDHNRPIRMEVYDWDSDGSHDLIGVCHASLTELCQGSGQLEVPLINDEMKRKKKKYTNSGVVVVREASSRREASFLEYLRGGCEISLSIAIDFTASNGNPQHPSSLHYMSPFSPNEYYKAITAVGEILQHYDSDKRFPVYGFGAKIPPQMQVSHCFPVNFNQADPTVYGLEGVLDAYLNALRQVQLYGPTNFATIIRTAAQQASQYVSQDNQHYFILLILTDGAITDMAETVDQIVNASELPLSIVIVGVGSADFGKMDTLDADDQSLQSGSRVASRDIVQFVPFREYTNAPPGKLARDTLAEIPEQLVSFMRSRRIEPNAAVEVAAPPPPPPPAYEAAPQYQQQQQQQQAPPPPPMVAPFLGAVLASRLQQMGAPPPPPPPPPPGQPGYYPQQQQYPPAPPPPHYAPPPSQ